LAVDGVEGDLIRRQVAIDIRRDVQQGGHVPGGLERWARAFLRPAVDWRRELRGQIRAGVNTVSGGVDYSYGRPSRRSGTPIGRSVVVPALVQPLPRVAVVVDTSASMSGAALERALAEIKGLLQSVSTGGDRLAVLACDTMVKTTQFVFSASQVRLMGGGHGHGGGDRGRAGFHGAQCPTSRSQLPNRYRVWAHLGAYHRLVCRESQLDREDGGPV
jgi:predicted metal-dependent peptidase